MKSFNYIFIALTAIFCKTSTALSSQSICHNAYVWNFLNEEGKQTAETRLVTDFVESSLTDQEECKMLVRRDFSMAFEAQKNEREILSVNDIEDYKSRLRTEAAAIVVFGKLSLDAISDKYVLKVQFQEIETTILRRSKTTTIPRVIMRDVDKLKSVIEVFVCETIAGKKCGQELPPPPPSPQLKTISLLESAPTAKWGTCRLCLVGTPRCSGHEGEVGTSKEVPFGQNSEHGGALIQSMVLEDNSIQKVLFTHPKWTERGCIKGYFPWIEQLPRSARFRASVGFQKPKGGRSGSDGVTFRVYAHYMENGKERWGEVYSQYKPYDSRLYPVDIDLSRYAGQRVYLELRVDAGASAGQDWAVWVNPRIEGYE